MDPGWDDPTDRRRAYSVDVAGLGGPRNRPGRAAVLALLVVVALVAGGILSSQLFPAQQTAIAPSLSPLAVVSASPSTAPSASASAGPSVGPVPTGPLTARLTADPVNVVALIASIPRHGTGPLAFVAGHLHTRPRACDVGSPLSACMTIYIDGLRGTTVVPDDTMQGWPGDPVAGETLVLLPRDGELVFIGSIVVDSAGIPRVDVLQARMAATPPVSRTRGSLHEADGVLVNGGTSCFSGLDCPAGAPTVLTVPPDGGGAVDVAAALPVTILPGAFGISDTAVWTTGPFLLRSTVRGDGLLWDVVAREDQGSILHVAIP
jgi:hypothetical protein